MQKLQGPIHNLFEVFADHGNLTIVATPIASRHIIGELGSEYPQDSLLFSLCVPYWKAVIL